MSAKRYSVSQVARMANVTVRTLHHYDELGLLTPSERSASGYRVYRHPDLERLHRILLFRELGFGLEAIARLLDDPAVGPAQALRAQRDLLAERLDKTAAILRAVNDTLQAMEEGKEMDANRLFEGFQDFDPDRYADEARERWGETDAYKESMRRTKAYGKEDWARMKQEADDVMASLAELMRAGADAEGDEAMALAEAHREHIGRWFYPCPPAMHAGFADMYLADARFGEYFETWGEGLTDFVARAFRANARRVEGA
jgi:DNA-binding transcriptional MerR regulator